MNQNTMIKQIDPDHGQINCCVGHIRTNHDHLVSKLGSPRHVEEFSGDNKITTEWIIQFGENVFTVYDYKESVLYGEGGGNLLISEIRSTKDIDWSIGGEDGSDPQKFIDYIMAE